MTAVLEPDTAPPGPTRPSRGPAPEPEPTPDPSWTRPALVVLLGATGVLYLWGLGASGWANAFYSAAVQAGTQNWKAFFFGSSDGSNSITVDKPPVALWVMGISARIFGVNAWSILVPQALAGVASVGVLYASVKRWFGAVAGLVAGAVLAVTPVSTLIFRFNNPDAVLVLLLVLSAYCLTRALERGTTGWLLAAWACIGTGFLTKMMQAFLVAPVFALIYLVAAPIAFRKRFFQSAAAFVVLIVSSSWWVAIVEAWPKHSRPYIGGSQNNSVMDLIFGYNGFGRLTGHEKGSVVAPHTGPNHTPAWGVTGWHRMFDTRFGPEASWLIPAALVFLVLGIIVTARAARTDRTRAALVIWGGWLVVTLLAFSYGKGIIHPYYAVALAPAIGALVGIGGAMWWPQRSTVLGRAVLASTTAITVLWSFQLLSRARHFAPMLRPVVLVGGLVVAGVLAFAPTVRGRVTTALLAISVVCFGLAAPAAYSYETASVAHAGALPAAGPVLPHRPLGGAFGPLHLVPQGPDPAGGLLSASTPSPQVLRALLVDGHRFRWVAATLGSNRAAGYQLATGLPVMPIGGFNASDPSPTLDQFRAMVAAHEIHYFIAGGRTPIHRHSPGYHPGPHRVRAVLPPLGPGGPLGGPGFGPPGRLPPPLKPAKVISAWVIAHFPVRRYGEIRLYDLTHPMPLGKGPVRHA